MVGIPQRQSVKDQRIRQRMVDDARKQRDLLASEMKHYRGEFWQNEVRTLREIMSGYDRLISQIEAADAIRRG